MTNSTGKKETVLRSFPVPVHFKNLLTTVVINHPDYKNTTEFVIECLGYGLDEILKELDEIPSNESITPYSKDYHASKLPANYAKELKDFLKKNPIEKLMKEECETGISWNMKEQFFLQLKSKVPLSKYKELKVFYLHQIYKGLERLL